MIHGISTPHAIALPWHFHFPPAAPLPRHSRPDRPRPIDRKLPRVSHSLLVLVLAPFIGSFLGVLITRLPRGDDVVLARSRCDHCGHPLGPIELLPLLGALLLRGRCRHCRGKIDPFHRHVECAALAVALLALLAAPNPADPDPVALWGTCLLGWALLALAWIDLRHFLLPDVLTLPLLLAGLAFTAWSEPDALALHAAAALAGWAALAALATLDLQVRGPVV